MKIIVLTPVKNEAWILDRYLTVTSQFADKIIIEDQNSNDGSRQIYEKYDKVLWMPNPDDRYDEAARQKRLIDKARELYPNDKRILLALDADEILAANATQLPEWQTMINAQPGTILQFEKPDLILHPGLCKRMDDTWPLGFVDDGSEHKAKKVHSIRIPCPDNAPILHLNTIKILHYVVVRPKAQQAKWRMYSCVEKVNKSNPLHRRRIRYTANKDWIGNKANLEPTNKDWMQGWEQLGIDMYSITDSQYYWQDFKVLALFKEFGYKYFWTEDIWNHNWEELRQYALQNGIDDVPNTPVKKPSLLFKLRLKLFDAIVKILKKLK